MADDELYAEQEDPSNAKIFPQRLMEILSNEEHRDAIRWLPHGKAFLIVNRRKFSESVLPHYFRKTKWASFTRKLNRWHFNRISKGADLGAYYHEFFQRGNETLCTQMYCKNSRAKFAVAREAAETGESKSGVVVNHQNGMAPAVLGTAICRQDGNRETGVVREGRGVDERNMISAMMNSQMRNDMPPLTRFPAVGAPTNLSVAGLLSGLSVTMGNTYSMDQTRMLLVSSRNRHENMAHADTTKAILDSAISVLKRSEELELQRGTLTSSGGGDLKFCGNASNAA